MTRNLKARRWLARTATGVGVILGLVSAGPLAWGLGAIVGAVLFAFGGAKWIDCNAELMRREGTTRRAGAS